MRIAKGDFYEPFVPVKSLSETDYAKMVEAIKTEVDEAEVLDLGDLESSILVSRGFGLKNATGNDFDKAVKSITQKIIDTPSELDEDGEILQEEVSHYDYKVGNLFHAEEG